MALRRLAHESTCNGTPLGTRWVWRRGRIRLRQLDAQAVVSSLRDEKATLPSGLSTGINSIIARLSAEENAAGVGVVWHERRRGPCSSHCTSRTLKVGHVYLPFHLPACCI